MNISLDTRNAEHDRIAQEIEQSNVRITVLPPQKKPKHRSKYTAQLSPAQAEYQSELKRLKK